MPPLWLIIGAIVIIGLTRLVDRLILKPRGETLIVDGKAVRVSRKRDAQMLAAVISGMFIVVGVIGALVEHSVLLLLLFVLPFGGVTAWSIWQASREPDSVPTEKEIRAGKTLARGILPAFAVMVLQIGLGEAARFTDGVVSLLLYAVDFALFPVWLWLLWRFLREARRVRANSASG